MMLSQSKNEKIHNAAACRVRMQFWALFALSMLAPNLYAQNGEAVVQTPVIVSSDEIVYEEPQGEEWEQIECNSQGCRYRHRITKRVLFFIKDKVVGSLVPGLRTKSERSQTTTSSEMTESPASTDDESRLTSDGVHYHFVSKKQMTKALHLAIKNGKKIAVIQLGNLEACPPCQRINSAIKSQILASRSDVAVLDFNAFYNSHSDVMDFYAAEIPAAFRINRRFSFPQIYVLDIDPKTDWWRFKETINGQQNSTDTVLAKIRGVISLNESNDLGGIKDLDQ